MIISPSQLPEKLFENAVAVYASTVIPKKDSEPDKNNVDYSLARAVTPQDIADSTMTAKVDQLGKLIAEDTDWTYVWGSGDVGLMDASSSSFEKSKSRRDRKLIGIGLQQYLNLGMKKSDPENGVLISAPYSRSERIRNLLKPRFSIVCPGGTGTFDELANALEELKSSNDKTRVVGILNVNGFFDEHLNNILKTAVGQGFVKKEVFDKQVVISSDPKELISQMKKKHLVLSQANKAKNETKLPRLGKHVALPFSSNGEAFTRAERLIEEDHQIRCDRSFVQKSRERLFGENTEMHELAEAIATGDRKQISDGIGDVILNLVGLARKFSINAGEALSNSVNKTINRFNKSAEKYESHGYIRLDQVPKELKAQIDEKVKLELEHQQQKAIQTSLYTAV
jgi:predicted Rossmann-fold nucleotide-binding protein/NTP pyrophosphatase (non-canonical NTP hydrolase)